MAPAFRRHGERLVEARQLACPSDERNVLARQAGEGSLGTWKRPPRSRLGNHPFKRPSAKHVLIELLGFGFGPDTELSAEQGTASLVLTQGGAAPAELRIHAHQGAVNGLLQGI
ncbi:MAG TPA: hypothetical protein VMS64_00705 [Candidatus Methylomirabilis sp.]|nr:hypothetical protein [Candidatus Methylomirabilis sp.]